MNQDLKGINVLVTAGPTIEYIDPIRIITNQSSGRMGIALAENCYQRGAQVSLIYGTGKVDPPKHLNVKNVKTTEEMYKMVLSELQDRRYDIVFACAACADFKPIKFSEHKIKSQGVSEIVLILQPTVKIIEAIKKTSPETFLVAFKAEYNRSRDELVEVAYDRLVLCNADIIVANDVAKPNVGFQSLTNEVLVIDQAKNIIEIPLADKTIIAEKIVDIVVKKIKVKP